MNLSRLNKPLFFILLLFLSIDCHSWGFHAHRIINRKAVYSLPDELFKFYKANIDYLSEHSVDPDKRRYSMKKEGPRHYIDLDHYINTNNQVLTSVKINIPLYWDSAIVKLTEDTLNSYGVLPWHLNYMTYRLTRAFEKLDVEQILKISAELGHYTADAHVPLHTTKNYNGQLTGQKGIHALWESRIPERKSEDFELFAGKANYIENVQLAIWQVIAESHEHVPYVLNTEKELRESFDPDKVYRPSTVGRSVSPQYTSAYVESYCVSNVALVEARMKEAIRLTASLWMTAWINAGQPKLNDLERLKFEGIKKGDQIKEPDHLH